MLELPKMTSTLSLLLTSHQPFYPGVLKPLMFKSINTIHVKPKNQDGHQWIVAQGLLSALTIPGFM